MTFLFIMSFESAQADEAVLQSQKELYRQERWDEFFASAIYSRAHWSQSEMSDETKDHLFALELLALARHCQWGPIQELTLVYLNEKTKTAFSRSHRAMGVIQVKTEYQQYLSDPKKPKTTVVERLKSRRDHWSLNLSQFLSVSNPQHLRVKVDSLCH